MSSTHSHPHDHHDHAAHAGERRLLIACALTGLFMVAEIVGGIVSGSLALLADAGHMFVDFAGLALALFAVRLARRPADGRRTFGYDRFQILVAYSNGLVLFGISGFILYEAWRRLAEPVEILGGTMLAVAVSGLAVNVVAYFVLHGGDREDLNMRGALLHVMGDLLGSIAAIAASLIILATGWTPIDPILSVLVCLLILGNAYRLIRESGHILIEGAPGDVDPAAVKRELADVAGVRDVHHVHVWMITPKRRAATLHARLADGAEGTVATRAIKAVLAARFGIDHTTVEVEYDRCADETHDAGHDHGPGHNHDHNHDAVPHRHPA